MISIILFLNLFFASPAKNDSQYYKKTNTAIQYRELTVKTKKNVSKDSFYIAPVPKPKTKQVK